LKGVSVKRRPRLIQTLYNLFQDFESGPLAMAGSRTSEQSTNRMNRLTIAANYPPNIALAQLQFENGRFTAGNFREHHLIGILD
jgi:hypothetical protein